MSEQSSKPKVDRSKYIIEKQENQTIYKHYSEVAGANFKIRRNKNCTIYVLDYSSGMFIDDCENCKIITGPIDGSIMIRTSKNCSISTIARQLRFRDCENIKCFTYCPTDPAVESSFNIFFAPFNSFFPHLKELFQNANFNQNESNHINSPYDFTPDKDLGNGAKHFLMLPENEFVIEKIQDGNGKIEEMWDGYSQSEEIIMKNGGVQFDEENNENNNNEVNFDNVNNVNSNVNVNDNVNVNVNDDDRSSKIKTGDITENNAFEFSEISSHVNNNNMNNMNMNMNNMNLNNNQDAFNFTNEVPFDNNNNNLNNLNNLNNNNNTFDLNSNFTENQFMNNTEISPEEIKRQEQREEELKERQKKIREKQELEMKLKNEFRQKASEFLNNFFKERQNRIKNNLEQNKIKENNEKNEKNLIKKGDPNINVWERVCKNIDLKDSDYKGSKDVTRMREVIINRKNDFNLNNNNTNNNF